MTLPVRVEHAREVARLREHPSHAEFVVIGAAALGHHLPLPRTTDDADRALVVKPAELATLLTDLGLRISATPNCARTPTRSSFTCAGEASA